MTELFIGVDVGGTTVKLGICDSDGRVRAQGSVPVDPVASPDTMLDAIATAARTLAPATGDPRACGVGVPGQLDVDRRTLARAINLPAWKDVAIPGMLAARLGIPVILENDANCAAWGELRAGIGRGARSLVLFTLGTGVGGGIVLDGTLWTGANGSAGALGHMVIDPDGPTCGCGQRGCLEQFASATAVARRFGRGTAEAAFAAARNGDADAATAVAEACGALAIACADVIHMLQPELVVLGGGLAEAGEALLGPVRDGVRRRVRAAWLARTRIELATLGSSAGWIGAALWSARNPETSHASDARAMTARG